MRCRWCQDTWMQPRLSESLANSSQQNSNRKWLMNEEVDLVSRSSFFTLRPRQCFFSPSLCGWLVPSGEGNHPVFSGTITGFLKCRWGPPSSGNGYMCQDSGVDSQSTRKHWKQHNLKANPDGIFPHNAAGLNSSYCRIFVTNWTHTQFCQRHLSLEISSTSRKHNKTLRIRHRRPQRLFSDSHLSKRL